jgi:hypothetical protein
MHHSSLPNVPTSRSYRPTATHYGVLLIVSRRLCYLNVVFLIVSRRLCYLNVVLMNERSFKLQKKTVKVATATSVNFRHTNTISTFSNQVNIAPLHKQGISTRQQLVLASESDEKKKWQYYKQAHRVHRMATTMQSRTPDHLQKATAGRSSARIATA